MSFHLYTKNSLTSLAESYHEARCSRLNLFRSPSLFTPEVVAIPTQGMQIWLEHYLVDKGEVVANRSWPRIQKVVHDILKEQFGKEATEHLDLFRKDVLLWRILKILQEDDKSELHEFNSLHDYLERSTKDDSCEKDSRRFLWQFQLSAQIAEIFDQYLCFLPELLYDAENAEIPPAGDDPEAWQKRLWWKLCHFEDGRRIHSPASRIVEYCELPDVKPLKAPLTIFGASAMSVWFLKVFQKAASNTEVHFFYHNICDEFWGDQNRKLGKVLELHEEDKRFEEYNNSLLCLFGEQGRRFFNAFMDQDLNNGVTDWEDSTFPENQTDTCWTEHQVSEELPLLHAIQKHVRTCTNPPKRNTPKLPEWDDSLTIHRCHNDKRQVEELQNALLWLIQKRGYKMTDILVMAPDISRFAPIISSVLDKGPLAGMYTVSDKSIRHANLMAETFLAILEIGNTHFEVSRILNLLDSQPLRNRFDLQDSDITAIRNFLSQMHVRWGINGTTRKQESHVTDIPYEEYTWEQGLDRLLLAMAETPQEERLGFGNLVAPMLSPSNDTRHWLGALCHLFSLLRETAESIHYTTSKKMSEWVSFLQELQNNFFKADSDSAWDSTLLRQSIEDLAHAAYMAGCDELDVPYPVIKTAITGILETVSPITSFLGGKLTFCSMQPMRGIPCKVIAILGMDERAFPRHDSKVGFNLLTIQNTQENGIDHYNYLKFYDRDRTIEDRYIFLETLLAAQDYLLIFHQGLDDHFTGDRGEHPAAIPVQELTEYAKRVRDGSIVVKHRLLPESPENFKQRNCNMPAAGARSYDGCLRSLLSYDGNAARLAGIMSDNIKPETKPIEPEYSDFVKGMDFSKLPENYSVDGITVKVTLSQLIKFLKKPQMHFLHHRLNFPESSYEQETPKDYEPFKENSLDKAVLLREISKLYYQKQEENYPDDSSRMEELKQRMTAESKLLIGKLGEFQFEQALKTVKSKTLDSSIENALRNAEQQQFSLHFNNIPLELPEGLTVPGYKHLETTPRINVELLCNIRHAKDNGIGVVEGIYTELHGRHYIKPYLQHLALCAMDERPIKSFIITSNKNPNSIQECSLQLARENLKRILQFYFVDMMIPLPLFANLSPMGVLRDSRKTKSKKQDGASPALDEREHSQELFNSTALKEWDSDRGEDACQLLFPTDKDAFRPWHPLVLAFANSCYERISKRLPQFE